MSQIILNRPAPNVPYFTPAQDPAAGTAVVPQPDGRPIPKPFQPIKIRDVTFQNRIWVCPHVSQKGRRSLILSLALSPLPVLR
jgi:hypothetical protein